jgi:hypothetical protein
MNQYRYRIATTNDAKAIFEIIKEVAPEIPLLLIGHERKEAILKRVQTCCDFGVTLVALDRDNQIVGFLLAEADEMERFFRGSNALQMPYGGVNNGSSRATHFHNIDGKNEGQGSSTNGHR